MQLFAMLVDSWSHWWNIFWEPLDAKRNGLERFSKWKAMKSSNKFATLSALLSLNPTFLIEDENDAAEDYTEQLAVNNRISRDEWLNFG